MTDLKKENKCYCSDYNPKCEYCKEADLKKEIEEPEDFDMGDEFQMSIYNYGYDKGYEQALSSQKQEFEKKIKELEEQKQMIIKKEGYPASDCIAVLRKEIKQEFKKMIDEKINEYKKMLSQDLDNLNIDIISGSKLALEELKQKLEEMK